MPAVSYPAPGGTFAGYLAVPSGRPASWPAVVVIHEAFGLNNDIREKADKFATRGYLALAPDLFEGKSWIICIRNAFRQIQTGSGPAFTAIDAARNFLITRSDCTGKTGVVGFCMGGGFALMCAPGHGFEVAAVNYGPIPKDVEKVLAGSCPIVGSFGGGDRMGAAGLERLQRALPAMEAPHDVKVYPDSGHRFMTESKGISAPLAKLAKMSFHREDAEDAWRRIFAFFGSYLSVNHIDNDPTQRGIAQVHWTEHGRPHITTCKQLIVATRPIDALALIEDLSAETRTALGAISYGPYVVGSLLTGERGLTQVEYRHQAMTIIDSLPPAQREAVSCSTPSPTPTRSGRKASAAGPRAPSATSALPAPTPFEYRAFEPDVVNVIVDIRQGPTPVGPGHAQIAATV